MCWPHGRNIILMESSSRIRVFTWNKNNIGLQHSSLWIFNNGCFAFEKSDLNPLDFCRNIKEQKNLQFAWYVVRNYQGMGRFKSELPAADCKLCDPSF